MTQQRLDIPPVEDEIVIGGHHGGPYFAYRQSTGGDPDSMFGTGATPDEATAALKEQEADAE